MIPRVVDEEFLVEQLDRVRVPGGQGAFMVVVVDADGTVYASEGSDPEGTAPTPSSPFRIGSNTKVFTALLTLMLVDDGLVDLDAPAVDYVTRVPVPEGVMVRDLLQHTSGIPNYTDSPDIFVRALNDPQRVWTPEETIELIADREPLFEPGAEFSYSNTNYLILGVLIEEVTRRPFDEELRARIIEPLEMDSTYLAGFEEGPAPFGAYTSLSGPTEAIDFDYTSIATDAWAAGAIVSSAEDLHLLFSALFDGRVVSVESLAAMTGNDEYGFGIVRLDSGLYGHNGGIPGYLTFVAHSPNAGQTAFWVVTNDNADYGPAVGSVLERISQS